MSEIRYKIGDVVWTKMRGYPSWPSRIASPTESALKNTEADKSRTTKPYYLVYFFGSNNFAWMPEDTIKPYMEFEEENKKKGKKNQQFNKGLKAIAEYMKKVENGTATPPPEPANDEADDSGPPSPSGNSLSNDASNLDGPLCSIDEEIAIVKGKKLAPISAASKKQKNSHDSHDDPSSISPSAPASVQRDYSRTPFNQSKRKSAKSDIDSTTDITTTSPTKRLKATDDDDFDAPNLSSPTISTPRTQPPSKIQARSIITKVQQPDYPPVIDTPEVDSSFRTIRYKDIRASNLKFGFLGLGMMGQLLVKHLLGSRHSVTLWNRSRDLLGAYEKVGAKIATTAADVVSSCDITFSCLSGTSASKDVVFSQFGVLSEMGPGKSYVELSSIDPETCSDISEAIIARQGNFLAAPIIFGGKTAASNGDLIIVASGDRHVYEECASCFKAMSTKSFYLGPDYGSAVRMNLIASSFFGTIVGSIMECLRMLERVDLKHSDFLDIIKLSSMNSPLVEKTLRKVIERRPDVEIPINHLQRDLHMMLNMSEEKDSSCPITAIVNEVYKSKKRLHNGQDISSLYYE